MHASVCYYEQRMLDSINRYLLWISEVHSFDPMPVIQGANRDANAHQNFKLWTFGILSTVFQQCQIRFCFKKYPACLARTINRLRQEGSVKYGFLNSRGSASTRQGSHQIHLENAASSKRTARELGKRKHAIIVSIICRGWRIQSIFFVQICPTSSGQNVVGRAGRAWWRWCSLKNLGLPCCEWCPDSAEIAWFY